VQNISEIVQFAAELKRFDYLKLGADPITLYFMVGRLHYLHHLPGAYCSHVPNLSKVEQSEAKLYIDLAIRGGVLLELFSEYVTLYFR